MDGGDHRDQATDIKRRREALGVTAERFFRMAGVSRRALHNAETGTAGPVVMGKVTRTLERLEAGELVPEEPPVVRLEVRPGVFVTLDAENTATLGDVRDIEARLRGLASDAE
jgi:predicted transcriptional regulator